MSLTHSIILSLSFSRNRLAFAVFRHGHLEYYAGKTLGQYRNARTRNHAAILILDKLVVAHAVTKLAFPRLNKQQRQSTDLRRLYCAVQKYALKQRLTIVMQDSIEMRRTLTGNAKPSKANVVIHLLRVFPELDRYTRGGSEWERRYYSHVFTAIGSGFVAADDDLTDEPQGVVR